MSNNRNGVVKASSKSSAVTQPKSAREQIKERRGIAPDHTEVVSYERIGGCKALTRKGRQYYADKKPVTLQQAFRWFAKMELQPDGGGNAEEQHRFLMACSKLMKGGAM